MESEPSTAPRTLRSRLHDHFVRNHLTWNIGMAAIGVSFFIFGLVFDEEADIAVVVCSVVVSIFIVEWTVRLWAAPHRGRHLRRHWIDLVLCVPMIAGLGIVSAIRALHLPRVARTAGHLLHVGHHGRRTVSAVGDAHSHSHADVSST